MEFSLNLLYGKLLDQGFDFGDISQAVNDSKDEDEVMDKLTKITNNKRLILKESPKKEEDSQSPEAKRPQKAVHITEVKEEQKIKQAHEPVLSINLNNKNNRASSEGKITSEKNILKNIKRPFPVCTRKHPLEYYKFPNSMYKTLKNPSLVKHIAEQPGKTTLSLFDISSESITPYLVSKKYACFIKEATQVPKTLIKASNPPQAPTPPQSPNFINPPQVAKPFPISTQIRNPTPRASIQSRNLPQVDSEPASPKLIFSKSSEKPAKSNFSNGKSSDLGDFQSPQNNRVTLNQRSFYIETLSKFRVFASKNPEDFLGYSFLEEYMPQETLNRINKDLQIIENSSLCVLDASTFLMYELKDKSKIRALISGPADTAYAHGLYLFDIKIPASYPLSPPSFILRTTGNGFFQFNPKITQNGQLLVPILNTVNGPSHLRWNPQNSSLLTVLLFIQTQLFTNRVIQQIPDYENYPENSPENSMFLFEIRYANILYAIIETLETPPKGFEELIQKHFSIKTNNILETINYWKMLAKDFKPVTGTLTPNPAIQSLISFSPVKTFTKLYFRLSKLLDTNLGYKS